MEAMYYQKEDAGSVRCLLCPHHCLIPPGRTGKCHTRRNADGTLTLLTYGQCASAALDPIEKKPLRHFHLGTQILSLGSPGCNLACPWCQNWQISQAIPVCETITPESVYRTAVSLREAGNIGVAWTYNEPCTWYEFIRHTAPLIQSAGMVNVMVTNGYIEKEPLAELLPFIDAWNIDPQGLERRDVPPLLPGHAGTGKGNDPHGSGTPARRSDVPHHSRPER